MKSYPKIFTIKKGEQKSEIATMPKAKSLIITSIDKATDAIHLYLERGEDEYGFLKKQFIGNKRHIIQYMKKGNTRYSQYFFFYNNTDGVKDIKISVELI